MGFDRDEIDVARDAWYSLLAVQNEEFNGVVMKHDAPSTAFSALFEHYLPLSGIRVQSMYMQLNSIKLKKGQRPTEFWEECSKLANDLSEAQCPMPPRLFESVS